MQNLSTEIKELVSQFQQATRGTVIPKEVEKIKVSQMASKLAFFYEKLRNAIDYQEEHLLRRNAIKRVLKRLIVVESRKEKIGQHLVYELIRAHYLENEKTPVNKIEEIEKILKQYLFLLKDLYLTKNLSPVEFQENNNLINWVLGVASTEIDEKLIPYHIDDALVSAMYKVVKKDLVFMTLPDNMTQSERDIHSYLAIHRSLIKSDFDILSYKLFLLYYPLWQKNDSETLAEVQKNLRLIKNAITSQIKDPLGDKLIKLFKSHSVYFTVLKDVILKNPADAISRLYDETTLSQEITDACKKRYLNARNKLNRSVRRSVVYIFITKMALGLAIETPFDIMFLGHVNYFPLTVNIIFHPTLMYLVTAFTRVPSSKNTEKIITEIKSIIFDSDREKIIYKIKKSQQKGTLTNNLLSLTYAVMYSISFGLLIYILYKIKFNIMSGFLFVLFLCIISFFTIRIKQNAKEMEVIEKKDNFFSFLIDFLTVPIVRAGRWISLNSSKVNIFVFFLDFIIEAPFKMSIVAFEHLISFVKEKKEDIY
ncbi:hypothetical protein C4569_00990 [Candidatus Parcubacteria bacterium]|nr:MAG: hypothetical protein C4569_00990 [Candidatus Parcubacteria bacterium]